MSECPTCPTSSDLIHKQVIQNCLKNSGGSCTACAELQVLESKILDARRALEELLLERKGLASMLNEQHDTLTQRLPVELVSRVFTHFLPFSPNLHVFDPPFNAEEHIRAVLKLGQICRDWRDIAHHTPELWTIFVPTISESNYRTFTHMANTWIERSGELPLLMMLSGRKTKSNGLPHHTQEAITFLAHHAERCRVLAIQIPIEMVTCCSAALSMRKLGRLDHLDVGLGIHRDQHRGDDFHLMTAPAALTLRTGNLAQVKLNWGRLTHFYAPESRYFMVNECILLFKNAPQLTLASLAAVCGPADHIHKINHPYLQTLLIGSSIGDFWDHFTFPALKALSITKTDHVTLSWNNVKNLLKRSNSTITDLSIGERYKRAQSVHGIIKLLDITPNLRRLSIEGAAASESLLLALGFSLKSDFLCDLRVLSFRPSADPPFDWPSLAALLTSMKSGRGRLLPSVEVYYTGPSLDAEGTAMTRDMFQLVMEAAHDFEIRMTAVNGLNIVENLRRLYSL